MQLARTAILLAGLIPVCSSPVLSQTTDYAIGDRDILSVTVWSQMDLSGKYTVDADGTLTFPLVGALKVQGLTVQQVATELRNRLKDGFFQDPQLTVSIDDYRSQRIFVMGQVRQPGSYPLSGGMTVIEALARAGSTTAEAAPEALIVRANQRDHAAQPTLPDDSNAAAITRVNVNDVQSGALASQVALRDGDTIFVPRAETVFVSGQVRSPGAYPIGKTTTVLQALTLAGGVTDRGATNRVRVIRTANGTREQVKVKLQDVLRPGDTVVVPERFF
jgi:polysaccharide export outer membrane protein